MIGDKYDIHCETCGRYLFTAEEVSYESGNGFSLSKEVRINDYKDHTYTSDGKFICSNCKKLIKSVPLK